MRQRQLESGGGKIVWVLLVAGLALVALAACALLGAAGWFYMSNNPPAPAVVPPVQSEPAPSAPMVTPAPAVNAPVVENGEAMDDYTAAGTAMYNWPDGDQRNFPYQVDGVEVRGNRAIGNYTPLTRDGRPDPDRPGGLFVAHKVNGVWKVYALGTDIVNPWAEPITRIYGNQ